MALSNFERMIQLADNVFSTRTDPNQLSVDEEVIHRLQLMHPASVSEYDNGNGPVVWILLIPTSLNLMQEFLELKISEKELYELTALNGKYEALYLCSAMVLEEYRGKGIAKKMTLDAIQKIREDNSIKVLFVWAFSKEGEALAENLARVTGLPLMKRKK